jgi:Lon protease-like protein
MEDWTMNGQESLNFELAEPDVKTLVDVVRTLLSQGKWLTPWEICDEIQRSRGVKISDSGCCARIRDCRKQQYGSHRVLIRKRIGSKAFEYRIES